MVSFEWQAIGAMRVEDGKLRLPATPQAPGLYRFDLGDRVYIGETDRLRRRFQHHRTPGPTQPTNVRLSALMLKLLGEARTIEVCVITSGEVDIDGQRNPLDLTRKAARLLVENAALTAAAIAGHAVENL